MHDPGFGSSSCCVAVPGSIVDQRARDFASVLVVGGMVRVSSLDLPSVALESILDAFSASTSHQFSTALTGSPSVPCDAGECVPSSQLARPSILLITAFA